MFNLYILLLIFLPSSIMAQESLARHQLRLSIGVGYEDGLLLQKPVIPAIGIGYDYNVSKLLALSFNALTYYRSHNDDPRFEGYFGSNVIGEIRPGFPSISGIGEEELLSNGLIALNTQRTIKAFYLPVDFGITLNLLNRKKHLIGLNAGITVMYSSYNFWKTYFLMDQIILENGVIIDEPSYIALGADFHSITTHLSLKLLYAYKFSNNFSLGLRFSNYFTISESSLFFLFTL